MTMVLHALYFMTYRHQRTWAITLLVCLLWE